MLQWSLTASQTFKYDRNKQSGYRTQGFSVLYFDDDQGKTKQSKYNGWQFIGDSSISMMFIRLCLRECISVRKVPIL